ncbi:hypothetical protein [uncultured Desulfosarcina sp.]|uniref:hypothetical protein n=1 Tax=uncultured Desulfosarcina sp. TaxID=218289 RepID=UPI0029C68E07|nr:hypothetical protein [uncultured Desulfosarcina sp.]
MQPLFLNRLKITRPDVIELCIDTMVMDNDDAQCRHGVKPTYKRKMGFQSLQMNWGRLIVDAVFRGGDKHSNHGDSMLNMIRHMVIKIKRKYRWDGPIAVCMDSGFFRSEDLHVCWAHHVGYLCGGEMYTDIKRMAATWEDSQWERFGYRKKKAWRSPRPEIVPEIWLELLALDLKIREERLHVLSLYPHCDWKAV